MKKYIVIGMAVVVLLTICTAIAMEHVVIVRTNYKAKSNTALLAVIGPTIVNYERTETKLNGEVLNTVSGQYKIDDIEYGVFCLTGREWTKTQFVIR